VRHFYEKDTLAEDETRAAICEVASILGQLGATVEEMSVRPLIEYNDCKLILSAAEFYSVHESDFSTRFAEYGRDLQVKSFPGALVSAADYIQAQRQRRRLARNMQAAMSPYNVLLTASNLRPAPPIAEGSPDPASFYSRQIITGVFNVTANPAITICTGFSKDGLPLSAQIAGKPFDEATILRVAHAFEKATPWHKRRPVLRERSTND
jgi:aspartyl-tRNA(Asn)/glutamyl-tRNA(Gln) amidotransferase subunit A